MTAPDYRAAAVNNKHLLIRFFKPTTEEAASSQGRSSTVPVRSPEHSMMTLTELDRFSPLPCMDVCPVCGSDQVHGQACIATRLFRTIARLGHRGLRMAEIPVVDAAFLKACGIAPQQD
jgi:hypothetical protein